MRTEMEEQRDFVAWFRKNHPQHWIFAVPNGGFRNVVTAARMKLEGLSAGVPDLFIPSLHMFIEMKREGGKLSENQIKWIDYLSKQDYNCIVAYSFEDAKTKIESAIQSLGIW